MSSKHSTLRGLVLCALAVALLLSLPSTVEAQVPTVNTTLITELLNDFFSALRNDSQSSFPGTKLWVLKSEPQYDQDHYGHDRDDDDDDDDGPQGEIKITKYSFNNIISFKIEGEFEGSRVLTSTIRKGLPTVSSKPVMVVPGPWSKDDGEYSVTSWIVNASFVAAYNGLPVTTVVDSIYSMPYAYYSNITYKKGWVRGQFYKPLICFWCG